MMCERETKTAQYYVACCRT